MSDLVVTMDSFVPGSPDWYEQRRRSVGGSEIAPLLGIGKWESRFSLWHRKRGLLAPQPDNPEMEWGRRLEAVIAEKFAEAHPELWVLDADTYTRRDRPWQIASPDRIIHPADRAITAATSPSALLEVKTAYDDFGWGERGTDQVPVYYRAQCIWYLDTLGVDTCHLAVLIGGSDYREYLISYDEFEAELMRAEAQEFIATIERDERPSIDEHTATYQAVREMHPEIEPVKVELPGDLVRAYCAARSVLSDAKSEVQKQTSRIADVMGSAQYATFAGQTIARRQSKSGGTPFVVAAQDLPTFPERAA